MAVIPFNQNAGYVARGESVAENVQPSHWRDFQEMCDKLMDRLRKRKDENPHFVTDKNAIEQAAQDPYKAFWLRHPLGDDVFDCGNCMKLSATVREPVTDAQIKRMVAAANNRKDPPWETLYLFNKKGKPDIEMAQRVQNVINQMRAVGEIPADCKIHACIDPSLYPDHVRSFNQFLSAQMNKAAQKPQDQLASEPTHAGMRAKAPGA